MFEAPEVKQHFHLFTIDVTFCLLDKPETATVQAMNVLRVTDNGCITAEGIGQANAAAQIRLHQNAGEIKFQVLDCVVTNIANLGVQTKSEFEKRTATVKPEVEELLEPAPAQ